MHTRLYEHSIQVGTKNCELKMDTFVVVLIMTEYIVGHVFKGITYHHLLLKICTCGTIRGCTTIKINHENKVICTRIVMHWATIRICATNRVNTVHISILKTRHLCVMLILLI